MQTPHLGLAFFKVAQVVGYPPLVAPHNNLVPPPVSGAAPRPAIKKWVPPTPEAVAATKTRQDFNDQADTNVARAMVRKTPLPATVTTSQEDGAAFPTYEFPTANGGHSRTTPMSAEQNERMAAYAEQIRNQPARAEQPTAAAPAPATASPAPPAAPAVPAKPATWAGWAASLDPAGLRNSFNAWNAAPAAAPVASPVKQVPPGQAWGMASGRR